MNVFLLIIAHHYNSLYFHTDYLDGWYTCLKFLAGKPMIIGRWGLGNIDTNFKYVKENVIALFGFPAQEGISMLALETSILGLRV